MPNFLSTLLPGLTFGSPLILAALVLLPAIWWLLRVTPPVARRVVFPPLRLLLGLKDQEETPARTPWWLLLFRIIAAGLVIVALSEPMIGAPPPVGHSGPIVLFIDNGWTAAHRWDAREAAIADAINTAERADRPIAIVTTSDPPSAVNMLDAGSAERIARELQPVPYLPNRLAAAKVLAKTKFTTKPDILWLSDDIEDNGRATADLLAQTGNLRIFADPVGKTPLALRPVVNETTGFSVQAIRADTEGERTGDVAALGARGENLAQGHFAFADGKDIATAKITLPLEVRNETARLAILNNDSAGATQMLDQGAARRAVAIVSAGTSESTQPLLSDVFYLERALAPYADLQKGTISDLLAKDPSVLILADIGKVVGADRNRVADFVGNGGVLLRFAGERMTNEVDDLVPVKLRTGGRYLGGALAWSQPQHLGPFPDASPFNGLAVPDDVTVSRQILAEPSVELADRTWARLADGTPLVTAQQRGHGWIVLVHVTASPAWSTLPLSGLYVGMMRRILALSGGARPSAVASTVSMPAVETLDGFGRPRKPPADVAPIHAREFPKTLATRAHPPGLYGAEGSALALNAVTKETALVPFQNLGHSIEAYAGAQAVMLGPNILAIALLLILFDAIISLALRGHLHLPRFARGAAVVVVAFLALHIVSARADDAADAKAALDTRLAYVVTGLSDIDEMSKEGLTGLGLALKERTSYEPEAPVGVNIERDDLSFFPLLYWPMDSREKDLSPQAVSKIADYMRNGGTILFDTRDLTLGSVRGAQSPGEQTLRRLLAKLDIPPLQTVPSDHVLTKAFYLLPEFPGRWDGGKVWVEALPPADPNSPAPSRGGDGVSPVIIGGNDWAAAWAVDAQGRPVVDVVPGGERQRELALRFGVNVVMYALTGNYKTDVVHWPALLERLGK
jgi:hypothetical protein